MTIITENTFSILVHASAKTGKSTLGSTSPTPILVLDAEGGWRFIKEAGFRTKVELRKTWWDPLTGPPPRHDGSWDVCVVNIREWADLTRAYHWLTQAPHDFRSVIFDSITEAQRKLKANLRGTEQMRIQDWGDILVHMDKLIRDIRDLTLVKNSVQVVMFIAETRQNASGKWVPYMQGQISISLPYWMDVVGYLYSKAKVDGNGQATGEKQLELLVAQHPQFEAGERVQGALGDVVVEPHVGRMLTAIFGETADAGRDRTQTQEDS